MLVEVKVLRLSYERGKLLLSDSEHTFVKSMLVSTCLSRWVIHPIDVAYQKADSPDMSSTGMLGLSSTSCQYPGTTPSHWGVLDSPRSSSSSTLCEGDVFNLHKKKIVVTPYTDPCPSPTQPIVLQCTLLHLSCSLIRIWICHTCAHTVLKVWENNSFVHRNVEKPFTTVTNDTANCTPLLSEDPTQGSTDDLKKQTGVL